MATVLPAQAALNAKLNRSRPTQKERKLVRQQQQYQTAPPTAIAGDALPAATQAEAELERAAGAAAEVPSDALEWLALTEQAPHTCPLVFTPDAAYCFIASGAAVRIYSVQSTELLSTLSIPPTASAHQGGRLTRSTVTAVLLSPSNPRQLVVGSTDGRVRIWDYIDGTLLRTLELGAPVVHAAASDKLPDQLFVALAAGEPAAAVAESAPRAKGKRSLAAAAAVAATPRQDVLAGVYVVSLRAARSTTTAAGSSAASGASSAATPVPPARRVRLAVPRHVRALALSPSGSTLASLTPTHVHLCQTADVQKGFTKSVEAPASAGTGATDREEEDGRRMTCLAFHPTENVFATGNEKGQIRVWYNVLPRPTTGDDAELVDEPSSSVLHWHAHAVSSLAFTPNGAYLLSGGREAVLVLWQLHSGHQEYVPRLGAEIETLTVLDANASEGGEQQVAVRLRDGSTVFVGSQRLRISKTIAGLKSDISVSRSSAAAATITSRPDLAVPLAVDPASTSLVLPAGHPSSLQFYSPTDDAQLLELEISPSNRVASANGAVEPTRVERVAFSSPDARRGGEYWMATVDSWTCEGYASVRQLKFWRKRDGQPGFVLSTRIDRPHEAPITSIAFSPSASSPLLLTTSTDGRIKLWGPSSASAGADGAWQCRASLSYRSSAPVAAGWSHDGSLFAVAHAKRTVTLWSVADAGQLVHAFPATAVGRPKAVCFADKEGTKVMCAGSSGAVCWDLLTLEETFSTSVEFAALVPKPRLSTLIGVEDVAGDEGRPAALLYVFDPSASSATPRKPKTRPLPHPVRQALWLPSSVARTDAGGDDDRDVSLAVTAADRAASVALVGRAARSSSAAGSGAAARLPIATEGTTRLFDEIFGEDDLAARTRPQASEAAPVGKEEGVSARPSGGILGTADGEGTPAHTLPPVRMLWRQVFRDAFAPKQPAAFEEEAPPVGLVKPDSSVKEPRKPTDDAEPKPEWRVGDTEAVRRIFAARLGV